MTDPITQTNKLGITGLVIACGCAVVSPSIALSPCPLLLAVPLSIFGLVLCAIAMFRKPRWSGVTGLLISISCIGGWGTFGAMVILAIRRPLVELDISFMEHMQLLQDSQAITGHLQSTRLRTRPIPDYINKNFTDPWNNDYLCELKDGTEYGYILITKGKDGIAGTSDDIDLLTMDRGGIFDIAPPPAK